uniref:Vitamin K-dependent protein C n=1 Tax=Oreochromis niloticus TaxID=8128 RepID=A0A669CXJ6_ORENI
MMTEASSEMVSVEGCLSEVYGKLHKNWTEKQGDLYVFYLFIQALLTENHMFSCGAIILSDRWILTAAHCVYQKPSTMLHITVGKTIRKMLNSNSGEHDIREDEKTEQRRRVLKVVCHEDYNVTSSDSDLALLKLHRPVKLGRHVVPICLPARNSTFTQTLETVRNSTVSGWGRLAQFGSTSRYLQRLQLPRVPVQECRLHSGLNITKNMICAGFKRGGPDKTWFLTGVVSWGKGCGQENMYGVYTKVTNFLDWIENVMATDAKTSVYSAC